MIGRRWILSACAAMLVAPFGCAVAAEYPTKPITIIVGFGAGGGVDSISRAASDTLSKSLGQPIVIQNKPGAGGGLAATSLKSAAADGYTLAAVISTTVSFDPHTGQLPYKTDDFEYIAAFGVFPEALVALPSKNWKTFSDVVKAAKKSKSGLTYASTTSLDKVVMAEIARKEGVTFKPVPTKGGAEAVAQTLGGHVDFAYSSGTYYAQAKAGKLHVLAGLGTRPVPGFDKAPTLTSLGYDVSSVNMVVYMVPKGTPEAAKAKLVAAFKAASTAKPVQALLAKRNMGTFTPTGAEISELITKQSAQFAAALKNK